MIVNLSWILLLLAFICFVLDSIRVPTARVSLLPLGLAFWVLSIIIRGA